MSGTYGYEKFYLPSGINIKNLARKDEKVCVVAIVGKSSHNVHQSKASMVNEMLSSIDMFQGPLQRESKQEGNAHNECHIEGYYDCENRVVYLHLHSAFDTGQLASLCQRASADLTSGGPNAVLQKADNLHARAILYLFSVAHIVLLVHPGNSFDVSYVRFFRVLDTIRLKLQPSLSDLLRALPLPKDWVLAARPCSPRVLFVFESTNLQPTPAESDVTMMNKGRSLKTPPIKRLQHAMEDQIYRILRKSRVITNISNNSLFAVPANQEFVYIHPRENQLYDPVNYYLSQLQHSCRLAKESDVSRSRSYQTNRRVNQGGSSSSNNTNSISSVSSLEGATSPSSPRWQTATGMGAAGLPPEQTQCFTDFLQQHIDLALTKGFDDNVGRNPVSATFEVTSCETWFKLSQMLYEFFLVDQADTKARSHFNTLQSLMDVGLRFSEGKCSKVLPLAEGAYQEGLPPHYTKSYHLNKVVQAKRVFLQHARGPACDKYLVQLEEHCHKVWCNGRQLCEQLSYTGKHCKQELHRTDDSVKLEENQHLPVMAHSSNIVSKATCNCGRKQSDRDDPFVHKSANYDFYQKLELVCCSKLDHQDLPVFEPSTTDYRAAGIVQEAALPPSEQEENVDASPGDHIEKQLSRKESTARLEVGPAMSSLSLALSLGQSGGSDIYVSQVQETSYSQTVTTDTNQEASPDNVAMETDPLPDEEELKVSMPVRQASTTEYLPGMIHSDNPPGLLPKFPSWSLLSLGKYSTYIPGQGLDQPGFLHFTNLLLPYDISVKGDRDKWPSVSETRKPYKQRKAPKELGDYSLSLRLYIGMEYECPRGHRFFLSGPDKMFKAPSSINFKETAHKVLHSDMPLYSPCHCRSSKGFFGQLMRVFVGVPEGPIEVKIQPKVQPAPAPCPIFSPVVDSPIQLGPGLWVLRLPFVYLGEHGPYVMPSDPAQLASCRLHKGMLAICAVDNST